MQTSYDSTLNGNVEVAEKIVTSLPVSHKDYVTSLPISHRHEHK